MKILWFTFSPLPAFYEHIGQGKIVVGGWLVALSERLKEETGVRLIVASAMPGSQSVRFTDSNIDYCIIPQATGQSFFLHTAQDIGNTIKLIEELQPDIVHIHGTERFYGLIGMSSRIKMPVVISIQGLLSEYYKYFYAGMTVRETILTGMSRYVFDGSSYFQYYRYFCRGIARERKIIKNNKYFIGRTAWDRAHVLSLNPETRYYHCDEIMRPIFYTTTWSIKASKEKKQLLYINPMPLKGIFTMLDIMAILVRRKCDICLTVGGEAFFKDIASVIISKVNKLKISGHIKFLGKLDAIQMAELMRTSRIYIHPTYIDNSPNTVAEAMLVGIPIIASYCGGIPSMLEHGKTALLVPSGDTNAFAEEIIKLLNNDSLALSLSSNARSIARERHDRIKNEKRQIDIYRDILEKFEP